MSATQSDSKDGVNISVKVSPEFLHEFDRAIKELQLDGELPMNTSRSDVLRNLMKHGVEDPSLLQQVDDEEGGQ